MQHIVIEVICLDLMSDQRKFLSGFSLKSEGHRQWDAYCWYIVVKGNGL